ncbi:NO-binding membrane sensor protein with MHYT domain [Catenulispora sp. GAS73]|uniref:MHYT domain-containing protein n=1 Tax=Catenulispora sp. GAS73 TaxID=3156269 RepID=UPI003512234A
MHVNGFTYGPLTPLLAYFMAFLGSAIGLQSASRARVSAGGSQARWLAMAAIALGGTAIWVMHFIAILGFTVPGVEIRYDPVLTVTSLVAAIAFAAAGLTLVVRRDGDTKALLLGGFITGSGVTGMHYLGMAAMRMTPQVHYNVLVVAASEVVAVVAATAALWFALRVRGLPATIGAAIVMGVAVTGMHYTGMAAVHVTATAMDPTPWSAGMPIAAESVPTGMSASALLTPLVLGISVTTTILLLVVAMAPTERELQEERRAVELASSLRERSY